MEDSVRDSPVGIRRILQDLNHVIEFDEKIACRRLFVSEAVTIRRACVAMIYLVSRYHPSPGVLEYSERDMYYYIERGAAVEHRYNLDPELKSMLYRFRRTFRPRSSLDDPTTRLARRWLEQFVHAHPKKFRKSFLLDDIKVNGEVETQHSLTINDMNNPSSPGIISCGTSDYWDFNGRWAAFFNSEHIPLLQSLQIFQHDNTAISNLLNELEQGGFDIHYIKLTASKDTLLHYAAGCSQLLLLKQLVENYKFPLDTKNICGETALMQACRLGMIEAVRYLLDLGASIIIKRNDGYLPIHCVLSFPSKYHREMLYSLTNKDPDLFFALVPSGYSGVELPDFLHKPMSVFTSAIYLKCNEFLDAVDDLVNELFSSTPGAKEGLWFQGLKMAASLHSPEIIRRYLKLLGHNQDKHLSFVVKDALEVEVFDRVLYHGTRYQEALKESLELLLGHIPVLDNRADCHFYQTALIHGHYDIIPFLCQQSELLKHRGWNLSIAFSPRRISAATFIAAGQFSAAERAVQLFNQRLRDFPHAIDYIDVEPINLRNYPEISYLLLGSPITSQQKFEILERLFDQGWAPDARSCIKVLGVLVYASGTNYTTVIGSGTEPVVDLEIQQERIAVRMLDLYKNDQAFLLELFEIMSSNVRSFQKLELFLKVAKKIGVDLNALFDSYKLKQHRQDTIFHELANSKQRPTQSNSWGIKKLTTLYGLYFSAPHHLLSENNLKTNALDLGIMLSNYEFVKSFIQILGKLGPQMPSRQEISRHRFLLEYTQIEKCRTQYNQSLSFYKTDEEIVLDSVGGDTLDIQRNRTEYAQLYLQLRQLAQTQASYARISARDYRLETQRFIDTLVNLDMDQLLSLQIVGFHVWEIPNYEPTMAQLLNQFDYLSVLLQVMEALLQRPEHDDRFPVMTSFGQILNGEFVGAGATLAEELGPSAFIAMLYVLGGTNLIIDSQTSASISRDVFFEFKDLSAARMNMGRLHNLFRQDLIDLKLIVPRKYPSYPWPFNGRVGILSELLKRHEPILWDEFSVFPSGISPETIKFRDDIWREMTLCLKYNLPVEKNPDEEKETAGRLQNMITKVLASFKTCNVRIPMEFDTIETEKWSARVVLVCCLRRFQYVEAQVKSPATEESTLRMREKCSRRGMKRLDVILDKPHYFKNKLFMLTHWNTEKLIMENKKEEAMTLAKELLETDHVVYMSLWNDQFPEKWKAEFESISHGLRRSEENRRRLLLGAAYCWYATENPKYEFLDSGLRRYDGRAIPEIQDLKAFVASCNPETEFEKHILSDDWNKSKWKRKRHLKYHWEDLWPLTERRRIELSGGIRS